MIQPEDIHVPATIVAAMEENLIAYITYSSCIPGAQAYQHHDHIAVFTGIPEPSLNVVMRARLSSSGLEQRIHEIMLPFKARNLPMLWWLLPGSQPHDLERSLCEQGLRLRDDGPGMVLALKNLPLSPLTFPGFVIEEVNDEATLQAWIRTSAIAFGSDPEHIDPHYVRFEQCLGYDPALPYRRFLGRLYGLPVATAALFLDSSVAGLYSVGVLPAFRSRGYGTAISLAALHYASAQGYLLGILQSSEPGYRIYARLGFQEYCRMRSYMWLPA